MWNLTTLKTTGQQRVAVLVAHIREVLARHADTRGPGLPQTIHKVPFLFRHRSLLVSSTPALVLVRGSASRTKTEDSGVRKLKSFEQIREIWFCTSFALAHLITPNALQQIRFLTKSCSRR